ncbi:hypothetical protein STRAU_2753 [Streptomyces aurantiacus JA 4570]|uniref:Uncharacterized protein n=1 Tax=Streptomyces aurantiacus JA 4570 TaxID=1286094 RepID=S3ZM57_9ACTN|nr:hypothetical protein STRAU_2753 [Streptomyces aurantiacus JA 4570]
MAKPLDAVGVLAHQLLGPQQAELLAADGEFAEQVAQAVVAGVTAEVHAQRRDGVAGGLLPRLPVRVETPHARVEEVQPRHVAALGGQRVEVGEQRPGRAVGGEDVEPSPDDVRGHLVQRRQEDLDARPDRLRGGWRRGRVAQGAGQMAQVRALGVVEPQHPGDGVQDAVGHVVGAALFESYVVVDADPGQLRQLLAAQPGHATAPAERTDAGLFRAQPGAAGAEERGEFGAEVHGSSFRYPDRGPPRRVVLPDPGSDGALGAVVDLQQSRDHGTHRTDAARTRPTQATAPARPAPAHRGAGHRARTSGRPP